MSNTRCSTSLNACFIHFVGGSKDGTHDLFDHAAYDAIGYGDDMYIPRDGKFSGKPAHRVVYVHAPNYPEISHA